MNVFVDTSGFLAVLDADDAHHSRAKAAWAKAITSGADLFSNNYVILETFALVQNRLGVEALQTFQEDIVPILHVQWVDETMHKTGVSALLAAGRRRLSLVDCVSFETMRQLGIKTAFTVDAHFKEQGFKCIP